jgi:RHS repeat-associated protein
VASTRSEYDGLGRVTVVTHPDGPEFGTASTSRTNYRPFVTETFDENDTDAANARDVDTPSTVEVDGLGRTVALTRIAARAAGPIPLTLTYDTLGNLRGFVDAEGHEKVQTYDLLGRVTDVRDPDTGRTTFEYDAAGNVLRTTDARGATTRSEYGPANRARATWREWAQSGEDRATTEVRTLYDRADACPSLGRECSNVAGRVARIDFPIIGDADAVGFDEVGYDARGRAVVRLRGLGELRFRFESTYDSAGRVTSTTYPDGETLRARYDSLGRAKSVDGYVLGTHYDTRGVMTEATLFNGVRETHTYDTRLREVGYGAQGPGGDVLRRAIQRDRVGNLLSVRDLIAPAESAPSGTAEYTHDALYRLTSATLDSARPGVAERLDWAYDDLDRILSATSSRGGASPAHVGVYTYSRTQPNTVVATEDELGNVTRYSYDAAGFMQMNGPSQYRWDAAGRLLGVQRGALEALRAGYGPGADRVVKREAAHVAWYPDPSFEVRDGVTTKYVSIGARKVVKIERTDTQARWLSDRAPLRAGGAGLLAAAPDGQIDAADAWVAQAAAAEVPAFAALGEADAPDVLLSAVARRMADPQSVRKTGLHHDHLGSLLATTDAEGHRLARVEHYPYGTVRWQSDDTGEDYEYTGKEHDDAAGLTYFGARYLDARLGRWVSADPKFGIIDEATSSAAGSRFAYVGLRPLLLIDPTGLDSIVGGSVEITPPGGGLTGGRTQSGFMGKVGKMEFGVEFEGSVHSSGTDIVQSNGVKVGLGLVSVGWSQDRNLSRPSDPTESSCSLSLTLGPAEVSLKASDANSNGTQSTGWHLSKIGASFGGKLGASGLSTAKAEAGFGIKFGQSSASGTALYGELGVGAKAGALSVGQVSAEVTIDHNAAADDAARWGGSLMGYLDAAVTSWVSGGGGQ